MPDVPGADERGDIGLANQANWQGATYKKSAQYTLPLPVGDTESARSFLEGLGGDAIGAGQALNRIGVNAPLLRVQYKQDVEAMASEISRRLQAGESKESIAKWASAERNRIIARIRGIAGAPTRAVYVIRDWVEYGSGVRTWPNIEQRYRARNYTGDALYERIIHGAQGSNPKVNNAAIRGASFLRYGGRIVLVVGVSISAARIWNASEVELPRVVGEEVGGAVGGSLGAGLGAGVCIVFGLASGGWGLLACGVIGGLGGGVAGTRAGGAVANGLYYTDADIPSGHTGTVSIEIPAYRLYRTPPDSLIDH